jgi:hypothetical protein
MTEDNSLTRRSFLATNAAVAAATALPIGAAAAHAAAPVAVADPKTGPVRWTTATAAEFEGLVGDRFRVSSPETGNVVLRLIAVEPVDSGPARPSDLNRSEGLVAVFDSPDKAPLVQCGHATHKVSHPRLGSADLFLGPICKRSGGHVIEMVLN